jgi:hypothetical protein
VATATGEPEVKFSKPSPGRKRRRDEEAQVVEPASESLGQDISYIRARLAVEGYQGEDGDI